jgi:hypothetical protein
MKIQNAKVEVFGRLENPKNTEILLHRKRILQELGGLEDV